MSEALRHQPDPEQSGVQAEVVDLGLVDTLYSHHLNDYDGMLDYEKRDFINHLGTIAEQDHSPEMRAAAKKFLKNNEENN